MTAPTYTIGGRNSAWRAAYDRDGGEYWPSEPMPACTAAICLHCDGDDADCACPCHSQIDPCAVPRSYPRQLVFGE